MNFTGYTQEGLHMMTDLVANDIRLSKIARSAHMFQFPENPRSRENRRPSILGIRQFGGYKLSGFIVAWCLSAGGESTVIESTLSLLNLRDT